MRGRDLRYRSVQHRGCAVQHHAEQRQQHDGGRQRQNQHGEDAGGRSAFGEQHGSQRADALAEPAADELARGAADEHQRQREAAGRDRCAFRLQQERQEGQQAHSHRGVEHSDREQPVKAAAATGLLCRLCSFRRWRFADRWHQQHDQGCDQQTRRRRAAAARAATRSPATAATARREWPPCRRRQRNCRCRAVRARRRHRRATRRRRQSGAACSSRRRTASARWQGQTPRRKIRRARNRAPPARCRARGWFAR